MVADVPKPLAPVSNRPFITYLIDHWVDQGIKDFVFLLHFEAAQIEATINKLSVDPKFSEISFRSVCEEKALGTGGAVLHAIGELEIRDSFLVANADTWLGSGVQVLSMQPPCALAAVKVPNTQRYGSLGFSENKISSFEEKSDSMGEGYVNSGLYHLTPDIFDGFKIGDEFSLEEDIFPKLVYLSRLGFVKLDSSFIDIGIPTDYSRFCKWIELGKNNVI